jgi:hypothetical protein
MGFDEWMERTGEKNASFEQLEYPDDSLNIKSYMKHLGLEPTHETFCAEIRKQCKANWRKGFTAPAVND